MDDEQPRITSFGGSEALLSHVQSRAGDMEKAVIFSGPVYLTGPGRPVTLNNVGLALHYPGGGVTS